MSKYLKSCLHHCGEKMTRPDVLNNPYCAGCEVYDMLQTIEEHVQMKLIYDDDNSKWKWIGSEVEL